MKLIKTFAGLVIVLVLVMLLALWILPARLVHWGIEHYGSQGLGAKVEVGSVDFSWLSSRLEISDLAVTNPNQPMSNAVVFDRIATEFDLLRLFDSKVYLDLVLVEGIGLDLPREQSGALPGASLPSGSEQGGFAMPDLGLPSPDDLIAKETALYQSKVDEFNQELNQRKENWQAILDKMPDQSKLDQYEAQWKQAKSGNFVEKLAKADELNKLLKKDVKKIKRGQNQLHSEYKQVQQDYARLMKLSDQSMEQIISELGLSDSVLANMGNAVVTGKAQQWLQMGFGYYQLLLGGESTSDDDSDEAAVAKTSPDFLVKMLRLTGPFAQGNRIGTIEGQIENISDAPSLNPQPVSVDVKAMGDELGKIAIQGLLDHRTGELAHDKLTLTVKDSLLSDFVLSEDPALGLMLEKALLNFDAEASIEESRTLNLSMAGLFTDLAVKLAAEQKQEDWAESLLKGLQAMDKLTMNAKAVGDISEPTLSVSTNLNDLFKTVLGGVVKEKSAALQAQVKGQLDQALTEQVEPLKQPMNDLGGFGQQADARLQEFNQLLKNLK